MTRPGAVNRRDLLWIVVAGVVVIGAGMGLRDPWPADEPVYALIARDMLAHGQWLIPMAGGDFFQDKPPLFFWLVAGAMALTGSARLGFLLPSLLAGIGCLVLVYDLARRLWGREAAVAAAVALLVTVQFTLQARRAQLDALLMFFTLLSLYCLLRQLLLGGGWRWAVAAGAAAGLGTMTKMVGFLAFLVLLPWLWAVWRGWPGVRWQRPWYAWAGAGLGFLAAVSLWLVPLLLAAARDPAIAMYAREVLVDQTLGRYASPWHHYRPWYYYLTVIAGLWMPLALLLPWLVPGWVRALRARDARTLLPLAWAVLYVLFFTLSSGKRDVYILSALPALVLAAAPLLPGLVVRRGVQWALLGLLLVLAAAAGVGWAWFDVVRSAAGREELADGGLASATPLLVLALMALAVVVTFRLRRAAMAVVVFFACAWLVLGLWVFPDMDEERSGRNFAAAIEAAADPARPLALVEYREHMLWNLRRPTWNFGHRRFREGDQEIYDAAAWLAEDPSRQLVMAESRLVPCFIGGTSSVPVDETRDEMWWVVSGQPDAACAARGNAAHARLYTPAPR